MRYLAAILLLMVLMAGNSSYAQAITAEEIIAETWRLYRQANNEKEKIEIIVHDSGGRIKEKVLTRWTKFSPNGEDKIVIKFSKPALDKGLGLLIWRSSLGDKQWLKLPSMRRVRKVSVSNQAYFANTDITYEDSRQLIGERIKDFNYRRLGEKKGRRWIIESVPKEGVSSGYSKRVFWIDQRTFAIIRIEYYGRRGDLIKVAQHNEIQIENNQRWRVNQVEIKNIILGRFTMIKIIERQINIDLSPSIFTKRFLLKK
jgi:outer membrane lipoprotein-sorting protein